MESTACYDVSQRLGAGMSSLPDELLLRTLAICDVPELLAVSRVSHRMRRLALDPLLHLQRLRSSSLVLSSFLPHRPPLHALQPPVSCIYLTRTHVAARKLGFSLTLVSLNRSLSRRPPLTSLVNANIVPKDCCRRDGKSGEMLIVTGNIHERRRKVEREKFKEGLRVWLERKVSKMRHRRDEVGVGTLVWRFSKRANLDASAAGQARAWNSASWEKPKSGRVRGLKQFWEELSNAGRNA